MTTTGKLLYAVAAFGGLSFLAAWFSTRESEDGFFVVTWKVTAMALALCGTVTLACVPVAWTLQHIPVTQMDLLVYLVFFVLMLVWTMWQLIFLRREFL